MTMSETRREKAVDAAYREWGRRHYRLIVGWQMAMKFMPFLLLIAGIGAIVWAVWAGIGHLHHTPKAPEPAPAPSSNDGGDWVGGALAFGGALLICAVFAAIAWFNPGSFRTLTRKAGAVLAAAGGAAMIWIWKGST